MNKRLTDSLLQVVFQFLFLCLTGILCILVMMIPDYISKGIMWFKGSLDTTVGAGNIIVTVIAIVAAMIAMFQFSQKSGGDAAIIAKQVEGEKASVNVLHAIIVVVLSLALYTGLCRLMGFDYIAGGTKALAPFMAKMKPNDAFNEIDIKTRWIAYAIVTIPQIPMMFLGYFKGFRDRMKAMF